MFLVFDNSIHLGQFCTTDESCRIVAKNSQISLVQKRENTLVWVVSFNENSYSDDTIWSLPREPQDVFYRFMDNFHTEQNIIRVPNALDHMTSAIRIVRELDIHISNAITIAVAMSFDAREIHSLYHDFELPRVRNFLSLHAIRLVRENIQKEEEYPQPLEQYYQDALSIFRQKNIDLKEYFHT